MAFDGNEGTLISLTSGAKMTEDYRHANPGQVLSGFVGINKLNQIIGQSGCKGIRIYYALNKSGQKQFVITAADNNEDDILTSGAELILDGALPGPPASGAANDLNS